MTEDSRNGLIGAGKVALVWLVFLTLAEGYFLAVDPMHMSGLRLTFSSGWMERFLFLAAGAGLGFVLGRARGGRGEIEPAASGIVSKLAFWAEMLLLSGLAWLFNWPVVDTSLGGRSDMTIGEWLLLPSFCLGASLFILCLVQSIGRLFRGREQPATKRMAEYLARPRILMNVFLMGLIAFSLPLFLVGLFVLSLVVSAFLFQAESVASVLGSVMLVLSLGLVYRMVHFFVSSGDHVQSDAAPKPTGRTTRIARAGLVLTGVLAALAVTSMIMPRCRLTALGWVRGETCARGLPTSYWLGEMRAASTIDIHGWDYGSLVIRALVDVVAKEIGEDAAPGLAAMLLAEHPGERAGSRQRRGVIYALGLMGSDAAAAVPALVIVMTTDQQGSQVERIEAVDALGQIGPVARPAVPALLDALEQPRWISERGRIGATLKKIDPEAARKAGVE